ncbi:hypothetical protein [Arsenicicoccus piscis]|nr:hypothetical protein [Arsenicicoccus piscis]
MWTLTWLGLADRHARITVAMTERRPLDAPHPVPFGLIHGRNQAI